MRRGGMTPESEQQPGLVEMVKRLQAELGGEGGVSVINTMTKSSVGSESLF